MTLQRVTSARSYVHTYIRTHPYAHAHTHTHTHADARRRSERWTDRNARRRECRVHIRGTPGGEWSRTPSQEDALRIGHGASAAVTPARHLALVYRGACPLGRPLSSGPAEGRGVIRQLGDADAAGLTCPNAKDTGRRPTL